ncbi:sulfatase family protein [Puniceicoccus vermicola]|uniref:Sulfatase-like hydrolase/transferase n=1 Tax=Puniceicoccus vermicola TaxID=388746 RepID=A0A7X1AXL7_9BACT|nr:sulfatase-like hydrolase/transferase [Puniceicoccus vermicola]MBC2601742.1 sulfatase-like hydrolase/transferase [Puniceicoccus vermicola]
MILADQFNASWMGAAGHAQAITPNLDKLSAEGVSFSNAYCQNPICTPSRVCIASSQYCHNHGYYGLSGNANPDLPNLFRHFRSEGYRTAAYGKLHLPCAPRNWIADDVDEFGDTYESADNIHGQSEFLSGLERDGLRDLEDSWHNSKNYGRSGIPMDAMPSQLPLERTQEMWCAGKAMSFMEESGEMPFCIQVSLQKPHHPLLPNPRFWEMYPEDLELPSTWNLPPNGRPSHFREQWEECRKMQPEFGQPGEDIEALYRRCWRGTLACVTQVDYVIGQLMEFLDERGLRDNTIVVFGSDHGAYHGIHGILEKAPGICSDEVCRVPMIWRIPGFPGAGKECKALVENIDIGPTLAELCGTREMNYADGKSLCPLVDGSVDSVHEAAVTENAWSKAVRWDRWRLVHYPAGMFGAEPEGELYDLESDPSERVNLYDDQAYQEQVRIGMTLLTDWLIKSMRVTTTPMLVQTVKKLGESRVVPQESDGRAANAFQPGGRNDLLINYL